MKRIGKVFPETEKVPVEPAQAPSSATGKSKPADKAKKTTKK